MVGPDHPMFGGGGVGGPRIPSGGGQFLPPGAVPPGARFDPIGPFGGPSPYRPFAGRPPAGRGGGRGGGPFSGEPDNDELPPPGYTDMFG